jgi:hypothetical protein
LISTVLTVFTVPDPWHFGLNPDPRIHASEWWIRILPFSSLTFNMPAKKLIFNTIFSAYYFLKVHLHHFSKIKSQKESQNIRNQGFSYYFCMMIKGSGSWRPKNMWIRIRNTGFWLSNLLSLKADATVPTVRNKKKTYTSLTLLLRKDVCKKKQENFPHTRNLAELHSPEAT